MNETPPAEVVLPKAKRFAWAFWASFIGFVAFVFLIMIPDASVRRCDCNGPEAQKNYCIANLKQIDGGIQQWALENKKSSTDIPTVSEVAAYLRSNQIPRCPAGGTYTIHSVSENPTCNIPGHSLEP